MESFFGRIGMQAFAGGERKVGGSAEQAAFLRRKRALVLIGVDEPVALLGRQVAHAADGPVNGLATVGRQLPELPKRLARVLLPVRSEGLPGFHAVERMPLRARRQRTQTLQHSLSPPVRV